MRKLKAADLFCGAGGTTAGAVASGAVDVVFALNHWAVAIQTHSANHPTTKHVNSRLDMTSPSECGPIDLLFASPECTHHSRARGGRPTSDQQRSGAWDVMKWVEHHRPSYLCVENVAEFRQWGPVADNGRPLKSKQGHFFDAWLMAVQAAGYRIDYRELNAADYGAATSRNRLFILARKGNRMPVWPEPTHCRNAVNALPGMGLSRWRAAAEVIDWNVPCPSIFSRRKPLADNTLSRLEAGLRRFVLPFIAQVAHGEGRWGNSVHSLDSPLKTFTTSKDFGLAVPFVTQWDNASVRDPSRSIDRPLATMVTKANMGLVVPFLADVNHAGSDSRTSRIEETLGTIATHNGKALALPYMVPHFGERPGQAPRTHDLRNALPAITGQGAGSLAIPWLSSFYGTDNQHPVSESVATITTKDRHSLAIAVCRGPQDWPEPVTDAMRSLQATMRELGVDDLLFRMLQNHELSAAQGFPVDYFFAGTKADITRQIGNSVSPPVAKSISLSIAG